ncbi:unnamed protein product [Mytilus coruscus]|uniref:TNFR-Cys domain-containing protein n=1 Tax=Mytilus coruscus TaxID=42192 RepID=A0A6J8CII9_MYTCO|nr:unnamed protein product [Mytilus coruscus]
MEQYKLIFGCFLICVLCYGLKCEVCKRDGLYSYHCEGLCNGSLTLLCDECCKLNGTWRCVVSTKYHQCETSHRTTTTRASISEKTKASGTLSTGAAIALGAGLVVIVIFVILYELTTALVIIYNNRLEIQLFSSVDRRGRVSLLLLQICLMLNNLRITCHRHMSNSRCILYCSKELHTLLFWILFKHIDEILQTSDGLLGKILNTTIKISTDILVLLCNYKVKYNDRGLISSTHYKPTKCYLFLLIKPFNQVNTHALSLY